MLIAIPTLCDLLATTLMTTGLIFIRVSIMQMLRGSMVVFSAILTVFWRKRRLRGFEWCGVVLCCIALATVGLASVIGGKSDDGEYAGWGYTLMGCLFVIGSQVIQAIQIVTEEYLLADIKLDPLVVVGMEGFWGMLMCILVFVPLFHFFPGSDVGQYENTHDTFYRLASSTPLILFSLVYWVSILLLNYGGMVVTSELTAVHRTIFEALRTLFIWITSLIIFYGIDEKYGEDWNAYSYMQLAGFAILVLSMLIYNQAVKIRKFFTYPDQQSQGPTEETSLVQG